MWSASVQVFSYSLPFPYPNVACLSACSVLTLLFLDSTPLGFFLKYFVCISNLDIAPEHANLPLSCVQQEWGYNFGIRTGTYRMSSLGTCQLLDFDKEDVASNPKLVTLGLSSSSNHCRDKKGLCFNPPGGRVAYNSDRENKYRINSSSNKCTYYKR